MRFIPKTKLGKVFLAVIILVIAFFLLSACLEIYKQFKGEKRVAELANELKRLQQEDYNRKAADTIGGKTPQETLEMFISAVEKGDYELASKYFVIERQEEELKSLQISKKENIDSVIGMLKRASKGAFLDENRFFIDEPISVDFVKYPSGSWKIEEI